MVNYGLKWWIMIIRWFIARVTIPVIDSYSWLIRIKTVVIRDNISSTMLDMSKLVYNYGIYQFLWPHSGS